MFISISFPTKTIKNAENLGVNFWIVVKKNFRPKKSFEPPPLFWVATGQHTESLKSAEMASFGSNNDMNDGMSNLHVGDDIPGDEIPEGRPRLKLKKRSNNATSKPKTSSGASSSIFGQARTREEILASKGIDSSALAKRVAAKTQRLPRMSKEEGETYESIQQEIAFAKSELEKAETEEAKATANAEIATKQAELKALVDGVRKAAEDKMKAPKEAGRPRFERPSERRRRVFRRRSRGGIVLR